MGTPKKFIPLTIAIALFLRQSSAIKATKFDLLPTKQKSRIKLMSFKCSSIELDASYSRVDGVNSKEL